YPAPSRRVLALALERPLRLVTLALELVALRAPAGVGERSRQLAGQIDPGRAPDPERVRPLVERPALGLSDGVRVRPDAEVVEEVVRGDADRVDEVQRPIDSAAGVLPALAAEAELARVVEQVVDRPQPALERRRRGDRLERRAR